MIDLPIRSGPFHPGPARCARADARPISMTDSDLRDLVCLTMVAGVGPRTSRMLLERFGTAGRALDAPVATLRDVQGVGTRIAERIAKARRDHDAAAELEQCRRSDVRVVTASDPLYPPPLQEIPDPPFLLYLKGTYEPRDQLAIALVGSRRCTPYGLRVAERLASSLARVGITVVSGLARGIDAAAHRGALKAGGGAPAGGATRRGRGSPPP